MPQTRNETGSGPSFGRMTATVVTAIFCRVVLNSARRFAYPFAPVLSRGLGVPLTAVTSLIAVNQATGVLGLFIGPLADRLGYRLMMMAAMALLTAGMLAAGLFPVYWVVLAALLLAGLSKNIFDPAVQAFAGERIPFERRGMVIGILEFSWAGSTLVGVPLIGLLIDRFGWQSPFFALAFSGLIGLVVFGQVMGQTAGRPAVSRKKDSIRQAWRRLARRRTALGALVFGFLISAANDNLFVVYGAWLENAFGLGVVALGLGTGLIGAAEFLGEILTVSLADRIGLKRSVIGGFGLVILSYLSLPLMSWHLTMALGGLFIVFLTFEYAMVSFLSLCKELAPEQRATMMATFFAAAGIGRVAGALIGGPVWLAGGIWATAFTSAGITILGLAALGWGLHGWQPLGVAPQLQDKSFE